MHGVFYDQHLDQSIHLFRQEADKRRLTKQFFVILSSAKAL